MSQPVCWEHIKDVLPPETRSEIHANALILHDALHKANPRKPFLVEMAEEVCIALFCKLVRGVPKELR